MTASGVDLEVLVRPGSSRTEVGGTHDGRLVVRTTARAIDGRANEAVVRALAERFQDESLTCGRDRFARMFGGGLSRYAPPQQRVTPWAADLTWS